ncbi:MAG: hypothetical protein KME12_06985 [Trichocoleus desertorum ATA4-8-CV12]|jgi:hypothetical protein|nr:hypothetical protein [Trichocoleus desertorum ATA4-8-CV12]
MPLKTSLLMTALCFTLVAAANGSFRANSEQGRSSDAAVSLAPRSGSSLTAGTEPAGTELPSDRTAHPDEPVKDTLDQRFSVENSLARMQQIESALTSFRQLTAKSQKNLGQTEVTEVSNTDWETQNLGFHNWVSAVEGTLLKQNHQIAQLELELAQQQYAAGKITKAELAQKLAHEKKAAQEFEQFWESFSVAD